MPRPAGSCCGSRMTTRSTTRDSHSMVGVSITGSHDETRAYWNAATGREILRLSGQGEPSWPPRSHTMDGEWSTASGDGTVRVLGRGDGQAHRYRSSDMAMSSPMPASLQTTAYIADGFRGSHRSHLGCGARTANGRARASGSGVGRSVLARRPLRRHDLARSHRARMGEPGRPAQALRVLRLSRQVAAASFSPDGRRILTASFDRTATLWDARTAQPLIVLRGHSDRLWCAAFSPDGRRVITGSRDGTARVWDAASGREQLLLRDTRAVCGAWRSRPMGVAS